MDIVLDCDIISTLAKIDEINLLFDLFKKSRVLIPNAVYVELLEAEKIGFTFPRQILNSKIELSAMKKNELEDFKKTVSTPKIHSGEAEGITIAKNRNGFFLTNDRTAVKFCEQEDVMVLDLKDLLRLAARKRIVDEAKMRQIIKDIEVKDNTVIVETDDIFNEYND
ncbi:MAG: hypothetical protein SCH70_08015 [Candidatus Methanoperedens sp.]|nr:hypothetical protein [Candidatus Methanoperedens sp.]